MSNLKEVNTQEIDETYDDAYTLMMTKIDATLYWRLPSTLDIYQWKDRGESTK